MRIALALLAVLICPLLAQGQDNTPFPIPITADAKRNTSGGRELYLGFLGAAQLIDDGTAAGSAGPGGGVYVQSSRLFHASPSLTFTYFPDFTLGRGRWNYLLIEPGIYPGLSGKYGSLHLGLFYTYFTPTNFVDRRFGSSRQGASTHSFTATLQLGTGYLLGNLEAFAYMGQTREYEGGSYLRLGAGLRYHFFRLR